MDLNKRKRVYTHHFFSEREEDLVSNIPGTITVEDYCKWYRLYYIDKDGKVAEIYDKDNIILTGNHCYFPNTVVEYAKRNSLKIDYISYAAICYMFMEQQELDEIDDNILPAKEDLINVLVSAEDDNIIPIRSREGIHVSFCSYFYISPKHFSKEMCIEAFSKKED